VKVAQKFTVARSPDEVWAFFQDVPAVARCMPGAELLGDKGDGLYAGRVKIRLGPFGASFEGEAKVTADPATHTGHVEGKGVDRRGGSRSRMVMDYRLQPVGDGTEVTVDADVTLAGPIAQFGRTGLIQETANILVQDFVGALERELAPARTTVDAAAADFTIGAKPQTTEPLSAAAEQPQQGREQGTSEPSASPKPVPREIRGGSLALRALWAWLKSLLRDLLSGSDKRR
jgi:carbon monoxide dehydrogenase subunit G